MKHNPDKYPIDAPWRDSQFYLETGTNIRKRMERAMAKIKQLQSRDPNHIIDQEIVEMSKSQKQQRIKQLESYVDQTKRYIGQTIDELSPYPEFLQAFLMGINVKTHLDN